MSRMSPVPQPKRTDAILVLLDIVEYTPQAREEGSEATLEFDNYFAGEIRKRGDNNGYQYIKSIGDAALLWGTDPIKLVEFARDIFERDCIQPLGNFIVRLRLIACKAYFMFSWRNETEVEDVHGWEAIQIFRSEKRAHMNRMLVFPGLYEGIEEYAREKGFEAEEISPIEPFKGMEKKTPAYLWRLRPPLPPGSEDLELPVEFRDARDKLRDAVQYIPVFGELYEPIPMAKDFLDLRMERQDTRGTGQIFQWSPRQLQRYMELREVSDGDLRESTSSGGVDYKRLGAYNLFLHLRKGIIAGMPGAGKTTILRHFAYRAFEANPYAFVVFIEVRHLRVAHIERFSEEERTTELCIFEIFASLLLYKEREPAKYLPSESKAVKATAEAITRAWTDARAVLLLDALDEAPTKELRAWLVEASNILQSDVPPLRSDDALSMDLNQSRQLPLRSCFLTVRIAEAKRHTFAFSDIFVVNSINQEQIREIARERYNRGRKATLGDSPLYKKFDKAIPHRPDIHSVAGTPLTAQLMVFFYEVYGKFALRYATYELVLLFVLDRAWKRIKARAELDKRKSVNSFFKDVKDKNYLAARPGLRLQFEALGYIARRMLYHSVKGVSLSDDGADTSGERTISRPQLERFVDDWLARSSKPLPGEVTREAWLEAWVEEHVLLPAGSDSFAFLHSTILEFLAASSLPPLMGSAEKPALDACTRVFQERSRDDLEVLPILCSSKVETAIAVLGRLKPKRGKGGHIFEHAATLPFRCLSDTEAIEQEHLAQFNDEDDRQTEERRLDEQTDKEWAYKHLRRWVLPAASLKADEAESWIETRISDLKKPVPLVRTVFRERYLDDWENDGTPLAIRQSELLKVMFNAETILKFRKPLDYIAKMSGDVTAKGISAAFERYLAHLAKYRPNSVVKDVREQWLSLPYNLRSVAEDGGVRSVLGLDVPGHPGDNNLAFHRVEEAIQRLQFKEKSGTQPVRIEGFLGSPNLRTSRAARALVFSTDGSAVVSADGLGNVSTWDLASGRELCRHSGSLESIHCCDIAVESRRFVMDHPEQSLTVYDAETGRALHVLAGHHETVHCCAITPNGHRIVSGSKDKTVRVWDVTKGKELHTLTGHLDRVSCCAITPSGHRIVTGSDDNTLRVWDAESGEEILVLSGHQDSVMCCAITPDGRHIVSGSKDNSLRVWNAWTGKELRVLYGHQDAIACCAITPDGQRIVSGSNDCSLRIWDAKAGKELRVLTGHQDRVYSCAITLISNYIVSGAGDNTLRVWDAETGQELRVLNGHEGSVSSCTFTVDGTRIISTSSDKTVRIWDASSSQQLFSLVGHEKIVTSCGVTPDGRRIVSSSGDHTIRIWDAESGQQLRAFIGHGGWINTFSIAPNGRCIASGSDDKSIRIWDTESGQQLSILTGHEGWINSCVFTPKGDRIVSASYDNSLRIWSATTGEQLHILSGHGQEVTTCAITTNGHKIVSGSKDRTLCVWDAETGRRLYTLSGHSLEVTCCAVTSDGHRIFSGSYDNTLCVWDLESGELEKVFHVGASVHGISISPINPTKVVLALSTGTCMILTIS